MTRGIVIAGNESPLFAAAVGEAAKRVESFASILIPNRLSHEKGNALFLLGESGQKAIPLSWNPASPISARTVVLAAENRLEQINDAILLCSPPSVFKTAEALTPEEIEVFVNDQIKGWFFLARELVLYFRRMGRGSISLAAPEISFDGKNMQPDLLGPPAAAAFRAFCESILAISANEPFVVTGFSGGEAGGENEFAEWFFRIIDGSSKKNRGRWHKYPKIKLLRNLKKVLGSFSLP